MNLNVWKEETFEYLLNSGMFQIAEAGPLCSPINSFSIKRDDKQRLLLTAHSDGNSKRDLLKFPKLAAGTVHSNVACVVLSSSFMTMVAKGVWSFSRNRQPNPVTRVHETTEIASVDSLEVAPDDIERVHQLIEWVGNVDTSLYVWPHKLEEKLETTATRILSAGDETLIQRAKGWTSSMRSCLKLTVDGNEIYIAPFENNNKKRPSGPGFILYKKFPCDEIRRKIRECLSFAFGLPLVYLGYTLLSDEFEFIGFKAVTPYIIDESIFSSQALPPAPVGSRAPRFIDPNVFSRTVNALFAHYDELDFRHVSWIYWHAIYSPSHAKPVQLGAGIEALQRAYKKIAQSQYRTSILDKKNACYLRTEFLKVVEAMAIDDAEKKLLLDKASELNSPSQRVQSERFFASLSLDMGEREKNAWQRRNNAAHGHMANRGDSIELIRDTHLLQNTFNRVVLSMTGASSQYIDCYSPKFPVRQLKESVEGPDRNYFEG